MDVNLYGGFIFDQLLKSLKYSEMDVNTNQPPSASQGLPCLKYSEMDVNVIG